MVKICPISDRNINENLTRFNAFYTFAFALGFLFTGNFWFLPVIIIDFSLRLMLNGKMNPIIWFNSFLIDIINIPALMINAGPKIFAARIGLTLAVFGLIFAVFGFSMGAQITVGILGFFSFLEFSLGICVACKIYPYALYLNNLKL